MMNKLAYHARSLRIVERSRREWLARLSRGTGLAYYPRVLMSYGRRLMTGRKATRYLGRPFVYDSPTGPWNIYLYQGEVGYQVLGHVADVGAIRHVLDIGANIGQFTVTLKHFAPQAQVDVFEPNPEVHPYLYANVEGLEGTRVFPFAVAPPSAPESMFFEPSRSGFGSLVPENAGGGVWDTAVEVPIKTTADVPSLTGRDSYDLVKIDVEGFEADVVRCLDGITLRYLYLELSTRARRKDYRHSVMFDTLRRQFGEFDIVCQEPFAGDETYFSVLIEFYDPGRTRPVS